MSNHNYNDHFEQMVKRAGETTTVVINGELTTRASALEVSDTLFAIDDYVSIQRNLHNEQNKKQEGGKGNAL